MPEGPQRRIKTHKACKDKIVIIIYAISASNIINTIKTMKTINTINTVNTVNTINTVNTAGSQNTLKTGMGHLRFRFAMLSVLLIIAAAGMLAGCASSSLRSDQPESAKSSDVDIDLTTMSSTMVYSEVYDMMYQSGDYLGKTVRMKGLMAAYHDRTTNSDYFSCVIQDATACCSQGIEFILEDSYKYPDDYPEEGSEITVKGTFDTFMEGEYEYCALMHAVLE